MWVCIAEPRNFRDIQEFKGVITTLLSLCHTETEATNELNHNSSIRAFDAVCTMMSK